MVFRSDLVLTPVVRSFFTSDGSFLHANELQSTRCNQGLVAPRLLVAELLNGNAEIYSPTLNRRPPVQRTSCRPSVPPPAILQCGLSPPGDSDPTRLDRIPSSRSRGPTHS